MELLHKYYKGLLWFWAIFAVVPNVIFGGWISFFCVITQISIILYIVKNNVDREYYLNFLELWKQIKSYL